MLIYLIIKMLYQSLIFILQDVRAVLLDTKPEVLAEDGRDCPCVKHEGFNSI